MLAQRIAMMTAEANLPISSVTVTVPRGGVQAEIRLSIAHFRQAEGGIEVPNGVSVLSFDRSPDYVETVIAPDDIEQQVINSAWVSGAWDIRRVQHDAGYAGALPSSTGKIADEMRRVGWISWCYRPMMCAPEIRQIAHGKADRSLIPVMLGRDGTPPPELIFGKKDVLRLGSSHVSGHHTRRATGKQRAYIVALRRGTSEQGAVLPASLSCAAAAEIIDRLLASKGAEK